MRVLVTGAAGFIGSHIASMVREAGHEVRGLDSLTPAVHNGRPSHVRLDLVEGDVRDPAAVDKALTGVDAVCHQAAMVGLGVDLSDLPMYSDVNVTGTAVLLEAMGRHGIGGLVFASSMVVYGEGAYDCAVHRPGAAPAPGPGRPGRGALRAALPRVRVVAWYRDGRRGGAAGSAQRLRGEQGGAGAPGGRAGRG
jgi:UDP-glucose 4-epimerase